MTIAPYIRNHQVDVFEDMLIDRRLERIGERRQFFGCAMEEILVKLLGARKIKQSGNYDICFDGYDITSNVYLESKSLKKGCNLPVYKFRLEKEASVDNLFYMIGIHGMARGCESTSAVYKGISETMRNVLLIESSRIRRIAKNLKINTIKKVETKSGKRNGYSEGYYNIPFSLLVKDLIKCGVAECEVKGIRFFSNILLKP